MGVHTRASAVVVDEVKPLQNEDILEQCLSFLACHEDFCRAAQVCRAWRRCLVQSNLRFWHMHLRRLASYQATPELPPFSQWNTGDFKCVWLPQVDARTPDVQVFKPPLIPWTGNLSRITHVSGSFAFLTKTEHDRRSSRCSGSTGMPANAKALALDLAFLRALNARITYAPIRIPLVDHTPNTAQVYPFIGMRRWAGLLSASDFFEMVGMHPEIAQVASVDEIVGVKAVKAKYELQLRDMRQMLVWRQMLEQQQASIGQVVPKSSGRDRTAPYWRFVSCLERLTAAALGGRVLCIVCRSRFHPKATVSPVPVFWVAQSRHGHVLGLLSSAKF